MEDMPTIQWHVTSPYVAASWVGWIIFGFYILSGMAIGAFVVLATQPSYIFKLEYTPFALMYNGFILFVILLATYPLVKYGLYKTFDISSAPRLYEINQQGIQITEDGMTQLTRHTWNTLQSFTVIKEGKGVLIIVDARGGDAIHLMVDEEAMGKLESIRAVLSSHLSENN